MRPDTGILMLLIISACLAPAYSDDLPGAVLETAHTLRHNRDLLEHLPAYTCLETIGREQRDPKQRKPRALDVVQVDVGVGQGMEIYSWPGERVFASSDLGNLVGDGFLETGLFHTFATNLFVENGAIVRSANEQIFQGRNAIRYTFTFPSLENNWNIDWMGARGVVGESGEFWVDKASLTLLRLDATANNFPPNIPLKAMNVTMRYETLSLQHKTVLIPSSAEIDAVEMNGTVYRDTVTFSQCHVFQAESRISNSPETLVNAVEEYEAHRATVPAGLEIPITLETEIRGETAKIGDAITARLNKGLKISPELTVPRGAAVRGRVREFRQLQDPPDTWRVGLEFNEIDWPGHVAVFFGEAVKLQQIAGLSTLVTRGAIVSKNVAAGLLTKSTTENIRPPRIPGMAVFFLGNPHVIPKGFQMMWRTTKVKHL
jgi:hypothetical protein